eukprot:15872191-Heterocapsa_arctica.AAC.1
MGSSGGSHALHRQRRLRSEAEAPYEAYMDKLDMLSLILNLIKTMSQCVVHNDLKMIARRGALHC